MNSLINNINFPLLKKQKETLIKAIGSLEVSSEPEHQENADHLTGILYILDSLQDLAVEQGAEYIEVFGEEALSPVRYGK